MPYIGNQPAEQFTSFATQEFSTSATTSYTLDHAVTNENEIALFINNVRQQPGSGKAYTATGTALTLSAATASTDTMYCVFLGRALQTVTPATNSITAAMVGNDLISGKTALGAEPADTDEFLVSDAGTLKRVDYSYIKGGGITEADMYRLTANSSNSDVTPLTNWERVDDATFSKMGTGISVSSGIFSFPSTGLYLVRIKAGTLADGAYDNLRLRGSNDNFSSNNDVLALQTYGVSSSGNPYQSNVLETFFNCTNVSTHKVKFDFHASSGLDILGDTNDNVTTICFIRLGDSQW